MYRLDPAGPERNALPFFRIDCGDRGAFTFRRLPPAAWGRTYAGISVPLINSQATVAAVAEQIKADGADAAGLLRKQADALSDLAWCYGYVIAQTWADSVWGLEALDAYRDPERRAQRWPPSAGELDECLGHAVYDELYDAGWPDVQIALVASNVIRAHIGGEGVPAPDSDNVQVRAAFF